MVRRSTRAQRQDLRHSLRVAVRHGDLAREQDRRHLRHRWPGVGQVVRRRAGGQRQDLRHPCACHVPAGDRRELADGHTLRDAPRRRAVPGQVEWWSARAERCSQTPSRPLVCGAAVLYRLPPSRAGNIYGIPWRSSSILEFDPETKAIRLFGKLTATNFTWRVEAID